MFRNEKRQRNEQKNIFELFKMNLKNLLCILKERIVEQ